MTFPPNGPATVEAVKAHLSITDSDDDTALSGVVAAVNATVLQWPVAQIADAGSSLDPTARDRMIVGAGNAGATSWWYDVDTYVEFRAVTATRTATIAAPDFYVLDGIVANGEISVNLWLAANVPGLDQEAPWADDVGSFDPGDERDIVAGTDYVLALQAYGASVHQGKLADFGNVVELVEQGGAVASWDDPRFAHIVQGCVLLAARLFRRRNSPDGVTSLGDGNPAYIARTDPDVALLLKVGTNQTPAVG